VPELSVVIVSYNTRDILARCLRDLSAAAAGLDVETIVVDNGSTDGSVELMAHWPDVTLIANRDNGGFATANNQGLSAARAPFSLLLNSDAFIGAVALANGLGVLRERPSVGLVGVRLLNMDGTVQAEHGTFPSLWQDIRVSAGLDRFAVARAVPLRSPGPVDWVQGACMFVRMEALHGVGLLDTRFFMYSEEVEWCRRFWEHGWQVWYLPDATVAHIGGASSTGLDLRRRAALYRGRLGLRRRMDGWPASALLWICMLSGLLVRIATRALARMVARREVGRQTPRSDWELLRLIARMDPFARWAVS
jgi:N-acetylglucosaminyl-diphospho-decaprenol L-rhamnosyltransferase